MDRPVSRISKLLLAAALAAGVLAGAPAAAEASVAAPPVAHAAAAKQSLYLDSYPALYFPLGQELKVISELGDTVPPATKKTVKWYRNGKHVKTGDRYKLTAADWGKVVIAKVTYSKSGYTSVTARVAETVTGKYWIDAQPAKPQFSILSDPKVLGTMKVDDTRKFFDAITGDDITGEVDLTYQWYADGKAIAGATADEYTLTPKEKGKRITVRVTATATGTRPYLVRNTAVSAATPAIGAETLPGFATPLLPPAIHPNSTSFSTILAAPPHGVSAPAPITVKYQWFRGTTAIKKATKSTYKLTASDRGKQVWVRITVSKKPSGGNTYTTAVKNSLPIDYTIRAAGSAGLNYQPGMPVGAEVSVTLPDFQRGGTITEPAFAYDKKYQWLRNGKPIKNATTAFYVPTSSDAGKRLTLKVTVGYPGYIPLTMTVAPPAGLKVKKGVLTGDTHAAPNVVVAEADPLKLSAVTPIVKGEHNDELASFGFQWLRDGKAISKATKQTYTPTSADWGKLISVRATAKLPGFQSVVLPVSAPVDLSLRFSSTPAVTGDFRVGGELEATGLAVHVAGTPVGSPDYTFQWRRTLNGKTTVVQTGSSPTYVVGTGDYKGKISVRITAKSPGAISVTATAKGPGNPTIGLGVDASSSAEALIERGPADGVLTATVVDVVPASPSPTYTYRWYRDGVAISGATGKSYKIVAADQGTQISVQVTMKRKNFATPLVNPVLLSAAVDVTMYPDGAPEIVGTAEVGHVLTALPPQFFEDEALTATVSGVSLGYEWFRDGLKIAGATGDTYELVDADLGKLITVRVTATAPGWLARVSAESAGAGPIAE